MRIVSAKDCSRLRQELNGSVCLRDALPKVIGETQSRGGLWRFFSAGYPDGGIFQWNSHSSWKQEWKLEPTQIYAFGEDLFGNQLIIRPSVVNVHLWNHEDGSIVDLLLDPATLLETIIESGIEWIDFYGDGSLKIAERRIMDVPSECHLHWTTPLVLGGQVSIENTSVVERSMHLVGHAKLWAQLRESPR
jgi:hypothetical protein